MVLLTTEFWKLADEFFTVERYPLTVLETCDKLFSNALSDTYGVAKH